MARSAKRSMNGSSARKSSRSKPMSAKSMVNRAIRSVKKMADGALGGSSTSSSRTRKSSISKARSTSGTKRTGVGSKMAATGMKSSRAGAKNTRSVSKPRSKSSSSVRSTSRVSSGRK